LRHRPQRRQARPGRLWPAPSARRGGRGDACHEPLEGERRDDPLPHGELLPQPPRRKGRATAIRQAMLALRRKQPHPHVWALFVTIGRDNASPRAHASPRASHIFPSRDPTPCSIECYEPSPPLSSSPSGAGARFPGRLPHPSGPAALAEDSTTSRRAPTLAVSADPTLLTDAEKERDRSLIPRAAAIVDAFTNFGALLSDDGKHVLFGSDRGGLPELLRRPRGEGVAWRRPLLGPGIANPLK
jgi:hypothetical protein